MDDMTFGNILLSFGFKVETDVGIMGLMDVFLHFGFLGRIA